MNTPRLDLPKREFRTPYWLVSFFALTSTVVAVGPQETPRSQPDSYTFSLDVELVSLDVTVLDKKGGFVSGLQKEDFRVFEDGRPQEIKFFHQEDVPVTIGLVVDNSRSMCRKRAEVVSAALAFVQASNPLDEIFIVNFNDEVTLSLPSDKLFTRDMDQLRVALSRVECAGRTALYDGVATALQHITKGSCDKKALLVISDGNDNASRQEFKPLLSMGRGSGVTVYSIALHDPQAEGYNPKSLKLLSKVTGGEFFEPPMLQEVVTVCRRIAKDIRNRYTLAYSSSNTARDGTYRNLRVSAVSPGRGNLMVRTREGYFAPAPRSLTATPEPDISPPRR